MPYEVSTHNSRLGYIRHGGILMWEDVEYAIDHLIGVMKGNYYAPRKLVALARGGLVPATILAHKLDIRNVRSFSIRSYHGDETRAGAIEAGRADMAGFVDHQTLVIDDLWDTGETMKYMQAIYKDVEGRTPLFATLFHKSPKMEGPLPPINFPGLWVPDQWITFPWESPNVKR